MVQFVGFRGYLESHHVSSDAGTVGQGWGPLDKLLAVPELGFIIRVHGSGFKIQGTNHKKGLGVRV